MATERQTQQRVIDGVVISIEPETYLGVGVGHEPHLIRVDIGSSGYGGVIMWIHRSEAHRLIGAIAQAMSLTPAKPEESPGLAVEEVRAVEQEAVPF